MSLPNTTGMIIAMGFNCHVRDKDGNLIALVASFQATEDFQVQEATCIGNLGPVSVDPQGYTCSITMDGFLPAKGTIGNAETPGQQYPVVGGGKLAVTDIIKSQTRGNFMTMGNSDKIDQIEFFNKKTETVLATFKGVILTSYGISADGNAYVRNNVQMRALEMIRASKA